MATFTTTNTMSTPLNREYVKSRAGVLRILEAVIGVCGIISESQGIVCHFGTYSFYNFVVINTLALAIFIYIIYLFNVNAHCLFINCPLSVFIADVLYTILYLLTVVLMLFALMACTPSAGMAFAMVFGIAGTIVVGLLAFDGYQTVRESRAVPIKSDPA